MKCDISRVGHAQDLLSYISRVWCNATFWVNGGRPPAHQEVFQGLPYNSMPKIIWHSRTTESENQWWLYMQTRRYSTNSIIPLHASESLFVWSCPKPALMFRSPDIPLTPTPHEHSGTLTPNEMSIYFCPLFFCFMLGVHCNCDQNN